MQRSKRLSRFARNILIAAASSLSLAACKPRTNNEASDAGAASLGSGGNFLTSNFYLLKYNKNNHMCWYYFTRAEFEKNESTGKRMNEVPIPAEKYNAAVDASDAIKACKRDLKTAVENATGLNFPQDQYLGNAWNGAGDCSVAFKGSVLPEGEKTALQQCASVAKGNCMRRAGATEDACLREAAAGCEKDPKAAIGRCAANISVNRKENTTSFSGADSEGQN